VSTSGFYDWCTRESAPPTERQVAEAELVALIREIFDATDGNYGVPRMHRELRNAGVVVNEKRVRRLMRMHAMAGRCVRRRCRTTIPGPDGYTIPDLVGRAFAPGAPDVAWCQDIERHEAFLNLAVVKGHRRVLVAAGASKLRAA
jgi:transposase InsO family protein